MIGQRRPAYPPVRRRRSNLPLIGCGCLGTLGVLALILVIGAVLLLPRLPALAASMFGLSSRGETEAFFTEATPLPPVELQNAVQPPQVTVNLGDYGGSQVISGTDSNYEVAVGTGPTGQETAVVTFMETGLMTLCQERSPICNGSDPRYQNPRIDLRPGGAVIYADVTVPTQFGFTVQQTAGVVLQLDPSRRQFQFAGIDLGGTLYDAPPSEFGDTVAQFEQAGNDLLSQLSVNAGGGQLALSEVRIDDATLTLIMQ